MIEPLSDLQQYVGKTVTGTDVATPAPIARLAATLGMASPASKPGDAIPPGWHGAYFGPAIGADALRTDGQAGRTAYLPAVPLRRYRIGLDRAEFPGVLRIGDEMKRVSKIVDISTAEAADGPVVRLTHRNEISGPQGIAVIEERESVYFDNSVPTTAQPEKLPDPSWQQVVEPSPVLLFRYSALRFNSHRVHYDRHYAIRDEGLPGLVVQAALIAQLLLEMCRRELPARRIAAFSPRTLHPIHDTGPFGLFGAPRPDGQSALMWAVDPEGRPALVGEIALAVSLA